MHDRGSQGKDKTVEIKILHTVGVQEVVSVFLCSKLTCAYKVVFILFDNG